MGDTFSQVVLPPAGWPRQKAGDISRTKFAVIGRRHCGAISAAHDFCTGMDSVKYHCPQTSINPARLSVNHVSAFTVVQPLLTMTLAPDPRGDLEPNAD